MKLVDKNGLQLNSSADDSELMDVAVQEPETPILNEEEQKALAADAHKQQGDKEWTRLLELVDQRENLIKNLKNKSANNNQYGIFSDLKHVSRSKGFGRVIHNMLMGENHYTPIILYGYIEVLGSQLSINIFYGQGDFPDYTEGLFSLDSCSILWYRDIMDFKTQGAITELSRRNRLMKRMGEELKTYMNSGEIKNKQKKEYIINESDLMIIAKVVENNLQRGQLNPQLMFEEVLQERAKLESGNKK